MVVLLPPNYWLHWYRKVEGTEAGNSQDCCEQVQYRCEYNRDSLLGKIPINQINITPEYKEYIFGDSGDKPQFVLNSRQLSQGFV